MSGSATVETVPTDATVTTVPPAVPPAAPVNDPLGVLRMSERIQGWVALIITTSLCLCLLGIVGTACVRVAIDGDAPLTADITHSLLSVVPWLAAILCGAAFGKQAAQVLLARFSGAGGA